MSVVLFLFFFSDSLKKSDYKCFYLFLYFIWSPVFSFYRIFCLLIFTNSIYQNARFWAACLKIFCIVASSILRTRLTLSLFDFLHGNKCHVKCFEMEQPHDILHQRIWEALALIRKEFMRTSDKRVGKYLCHYF